jgi:hypothetical protein
MPFYKTGYDWSSLQLALTFCRFFNIPEFLQSVLHGHSVNFLILSGGEGIHVQWQPSLKINVTVRYFTASLQVTHIIWLSMHKRYRLLAPPQWPEILSSPPPPPPVALHSLKDLGHLTYRRFFELFRHKVGRTPWMSDQPVARPLPTQDNTTQHRNTRTNIHALSGIRTHDPSNQPAKTHTSDRTATVTGTFYLYLVINQTKISRTSPRHVTSASKEQINLRES